MAASANLGRVKAKESFMLDSFAWILTDIAPEP
jgi:hypothetical protein